MRSVMDCTAQAGWGHDRPLARLVVASAIACATCSMSEARSTVSKDQLFGGARIRR